jgi:hypothetical protein
LFLAPHGIGTVDRSLSYRQLQSNTVKFGTVRPPRISFSLLCQNLRARHSVTVKPFLIARLVMQSPR